MKLPWDERYLKISFHVVFTLTMVYILGVLVTGISYCVANAGVVLRALGGFAQSVFSVMSPLVIAIVISYLLEPVVAFFQCRYDRLYENTLPKLRKHKLFSAKSASVRTSKRTAGVIITIVCIMAAAGAFILSAGEKFKDGGHNALALSFAKTVNDLGDFYTGIEIRLKEMGVLEYTVGYIETIVSEGQRLVQSAGDIIVKSLAAVGGGILSFLIGAIIAVYFLRDKDGIFEKLREVMAAFLPRLLNERLLDVFGDINMVFSGYLRGLLADAVIMAVLIGGWLTILGVDFAVMIGIFSGLSNLVPYLGALIALALSVAAALFGGEPSTAIYAGAGILVLQQIDAVFIVPKIVGESVKLSPVLVLLSISIAGKLFGLPGMLLAVPMTAVVKLFLTRLMRRRKERSMQCTGA